MIAAALVLLSVGGLGFLVRLVWGPSLADRIVALDGLLTVVASGIAAYAALHRRPVLLILGVVVALVAFLGSTMFARFVESRR